MTKTVSRMQNRLEVAEHVLYSRLRLKLKSQMHKLEVYRHQLKCSALKNEALKQRPE